MGNLFSGGGLGKVLQLGASFIPGVGGLIGQGIGGLMQGGQQQGQATGYWNQEGQQAGLPGELQQQYLPEALQQLYGLTSAGGNQPFGVNTEQNAQTNPLVFGNLANRAMTPTWNTQISNFADTTGGDLSNTLGAINHAIAGRGFSGANTMTPAVDAQAARAAEQQVGQERGQAGAEAANAEQQLAQYQQQQQYAQAVNAANTMWNRDAQFAGTIPGSNSQGLGAAGNYWQTLANGTNSGLTGALGNIASIWSKPSRGTSTEPNNPGGPNQGNQGATPWQWGK